MVSTTQRILDAAPLVPSTGALAGWAAAYVHGVDDLDGLDPFDLTPLPLPSTLGADLGRAGRGGMVYHRDDLAVADLELRHGLPVTSPLRTAYDAARWAPNLVEAVAALDLTSHHLRVDLTALSRRCAGPVNVPGIRQLRKALTYADPASANAWETRLRSRHAQARRRDRREDRWTLSQPAWWRGRHGERNSWQQIAG